jgi:hypothetical protein
MKVSHMGIIAVMLVVIAVAVAGCTGSGTSPAAPAAGGAPSGGSGAATGGSGAAAAAPAAASSGSVDASSVFGAAYNWVEYKMSTGSGSEAMTVYMKWSKDGKCSMRFEGAGASQMPSNMQNIDCSKGSGTTGQSQNNPNEVKSDVKMVKVGTETVTVGAGTFVADKYTITSSDGTIGTYWVAAGKPMLKMQGSNAGGNAVMELNGWG